MRIASLSRRHLLAWGLGALVVASGCKKDEAAEPDVDSVKLTVGTATITVNSSGVVTGGPITVAHGASVTISASFLNAAGTPDPVGNSADFQFNCTPASTTVATFTRSTAYAGTLTGGSAAGTTTVSVSLHHIAENHEDFGPFNVPVTVN